MFSRRGHLSAARVPRAYTTVSVPWPAAHSGLGTFSSVFGASCRFLNRDSRIYDDLHIYACIDVKLETFITRPGCAHFR